MPYVFPSLPHRLFTSHIGIFSQRPKNNRAIRLCHESIKMLVVFLRPESIMRIMRGEEGRVSCVKRFSRLYCSVLLTLTTHLRHPCNQPNLFCLHRSTHRSRTYFRFFHRFLKIRTIATYTRFAEYPLCHVDLVCNASMSRAQ